MATTTYQIVNPPTHGLLNGFNTNTGVVNYTPTTNFIGTDTFTYNILCNGAVVDTATVTVTINAEESQGNFSSTHSVVCGQNLTIEFTQTAGTVIQTYMWNVPSGLTLLSGQGTNIITVKANNNLSGTRVITLTTTNPLVKEYTFSVSINCAQANNDTSSGTGNNPITTNVATNDIGCNANTTYQLIEPPLNGSIVNSNPLTGVFTYQPNVNFFGVDIYQYGIFCAGVLTSTAYVTLNVINEDPCFGKDCSPIWEPTSQWKCVNMDKYALHINKNPCYKGVQEKWINIGKCVSTCNTCEQEDECDPCKKKQKTCWPYPNNNDGKNWCG